MINKLEEKKSTTFGVTDQEFQEVFDYIKNIFTEAAEKNLKFGEQIREKIIKAYENKPTFATAMYLTGEIMGKFEMGVEINKIGEAIHQYIHTLAQTRQDTAKTDDLLAQYRDKKRTVN